MPVRRLPRLAPALAALVSLVLAAAPAPAFATPPADGDDPLSDLVRRIERYLRRNEVDGVTMDWRYEVSPSEEIRQTVVCQVNPVRGACRFRFALERPGKTTLDVFDARGRRVRALARGDLGIGPHAVAWDGTDAAGRRLPGGLYFARLTAPGVAEERRFAVVR